MSTEIYDGHLSEAHARRLRGLEALDRFIAEFGKMGESLRLQDARAALAAFHDCRTAAGVGDDAIETTMMHLRAMDPRYRDGWGLIFRAAIELGAGQMALERLKALVRVPRFHVILMRQDVRDRRLEIRGDVETFLQRLDSSEAFGRFRLTKDVGDGWRICFYE